MPVDLEASPAVALSVESPRLSSSDSAVCFAVDGALPGVGRCETGSAGKVTMIQELSGRIVDVRAGELELECGTVVKHLLPMSLDLTPLAGRRVSIVIRHLLDRDRSPTVDAQISESDGALLLWARDGALPADGERLVFRVTHESHGPASLVLVADSTLVTLAPRSVGRVDIASASFLAAALRVGDNEAAFILARI